MVWSVKYRRKILTGEVEAYLKELVRQIADDKGFPVQLFECGECDHADAVGAYNILRKSCAVSGAVINMPVSGLNNIKVIKVAV